MNTAYRPPAVCGLSRRRSFQDKDPSLIALPDLQDREVLDYLTTDHQVVRRRRLDRRIDDLANRDAVAHP